MVVTVEKHISIIFSDVLFNGSNTCSASCGGHFRTFDGLEYHFPGQCVYTLVSDCKNDFFSIELATNYACNEQGKNCLNAVYIR